jgi:transcriptional antiterminator NusG
MKKEWYVVNTVSGYEYKVKEKLEMMIVNSPEIQESIFRVIVPEQTIVEYKDGVKKEKIKKMFPGYVLVEMIMSDEVWFIVRNTQGVTGFIGSSGKGAKPFPVTRDQIETVLKRIGMVDEQMFSAYKVGDTVRVLTGAFEGGEGVVEEINTETGDIKITATLFGRPTTVEVKYSEIEKI